VGRTLVYASRALSLSLSPSLQVYTKIQAWTLEDFDRVVFMDADQLVRVIMVKYWD
jgi:alpha-N-acetylglucosamine transferase